MQTLCLGFQVLSNYYIVRFTAFACRYQSRLQFLYQKVMLLVFLERSRSWLRLSMKKLVRVHLVQSFMIIRQKVKAQYAVFNHIFNADCGGISLQWCQALKTKVTLCLSVDKSIQINMDFHQKTIHFEGTLYRHNTIEAQYMIPWCVIQSISWRQNHRFDWTFLSRWLTKIQF